MNRSLAPIRPHRLWGRGGLSDGQSWGPLCPPAKARSVFRLLMQMHLLRVSNTLVAGFIRPVFTRRFRLSP